MRRFLEALEAAVTGGYAHVAGPDGEAPAPPADPRVWGWRRREAGTGEYARVAWEPLGKRVGWVAGGDLYLHPLSSYATAEDQARRSGGTLAVQPVTLRKRLDDDRLLLSVGEERVAEKGGGERVVAAPDDARLPGAQGARPAPRGLGPRRRRAAGGRPSLQGVCGICGICGTRLPGRGPRPGGGRERRPTSVAHFWPGGHGSGIGKWARRGRPPGGAGDGRPTNPTNPTNPPQRHARLVRRERPRSAGRARRRGRPPRPAGRVSSRARTESVRNVRPHECSSGRRPRGGAPERRGPSGLPGGARSQGAPSPVSPRATWGTAASAARSTTWRGGATGALPAPSVPTPPRSASRGRCSGAPPRPARHPPGAGRASGRDTGRPAPVRRARGRGHA